MCCLHLLLGAMLVVLDVCTLAAYALPDVYLCCAVWRAYGHLYTP